MRRTVNTTVRTRGERFAARPGTGIWEECPAPENPYVAERYLCHGYDLYELMEQRCYTDVLFLLFKGELPDRDQSRLLETLMIGLINPGPRHPATRASMQAAVSKADPVHLLPISLSVMGGEHLGGTEVFHSMMFLRRNLRKSPESVLAGLLETGPPRPLEGDWHIAPGFGTRFGATDKMSQKLAFAMASGAGSGTATAWGVAFADVIGETGCSWLAPGVAAATFLDLGFPARAGGGLFQLLSAPGLLAHGLEMANKPLTAMPFIDNDHYIVER